MQCTALTLHSFPCVLSARCVSVATQLGPGGFPPAHRRVCLIPATPTGLTSQAHAHLHVQHAVLHAAFSLSCCRVIDFYRIQRDAMVTSAERWLKGLWRRGRGQGASTASSKNSCFLHFGDKVDTKYMFEVRMQAACLRGEMPAPYWCWSSEQPPPAKAAHFPPQIVMFSQCCTVFTYNHNVAWIWMNWIWWCKPDN